MTAAKERAEAALHVRDALNFEACAEKSTISYALVWHANSARLNFVEALISLLRFVDALPEPVAIPPVPQPSEEARRRGLLVGAVVRDEIDGSLARIVAHTPAGCAMVQWPRSGLVGRVDDHRLTVIRPAPTVREPNAEAVELGLYIGARVVADGEECGEVVGWDSEGDPIVEHERWCAAYAASDVTLAGDES